MSETPPVRPALPARYRVARVGTQDPAASDYYVLDVVHDMCARDALRALVGYYRRAGAQTSADELEQLLDRTQAAFADVIRARNPKPAPAAKGKTRSKAFHGA